MELLTLEAAKTASTGERYNEIIKTIENTHAVKDSMIKTLRNREEETQRKLNNFLSKYKADQELKINLVKAQGELTTNAHDIKMENEKLSGELTRLIEQLQRCTPDITFSNNGIKHK